jgi:Na+-translocating ferredoxin:NAD+ oxidoreductase RnfD subunit
MREILKRELSFLTQYFLIACIAAAVGHDAWESSRQVSALSGGEGLQSAVNVREMVAALWRDYYRWVIGAFVGLSSIRLLIVLAVHRAKREIG